MEQVLEADAKLGAVTPLTVTHPPGRPERAQRAAGKGSDSVHSFWKRQCGPE